MNKFINIAIKEALNSTERFRVGAVVFKHQRVLSRGHNYSKVHRRNLHPKFVKWEGSVHAEHACILKAKKDLKGAVILVVRLSRDNNLAYSEPCKFCKLYLKHIGIRKARFSTGIGKIITEILI